MWRPTRAPVARHESYEGEGYDVELTLGWRGEGCELHISIGFNSGPAASGCDVAPIIIRLRLGRSYEAQARE